MSNIYMIFGTNCVLLIVSSNKSLIQDSDILCICVTNGRGCIYIIIPSSIGSTKMNKEAQQTHKKKTLS